MRKLFFQMLAGFIVSVLLVACGAEEPPTPTQQAELVVEATIEVTGTELADGGWIPTEIHYSRDAGIPLGKVILTQASLKAEMWDDIEENGTLQLIEEVYMEEYSFIPITFEVDGVLFPGGTLYCINGTIYWYPSDIIPEFFENSAPEVNG